MPRNKKKPVRGKTAGKKSVSRPIWKGIISFGLVNIPVVLYSAESTDEIDFNLLDRRDFSPVRYRRVNAKTGREVAWNDIVKGYQYGQGQYVALTEKDFQNANVEATQSIDISDFVDATEISPIYFEKPYYLEPLKNGQRAYELLRQALAKTQKVAIAKIVIRTRQHLAALLPHGLRLVVVLLRFSHELRDAKPLALPETGSRSGKISDREVKMAEQLVESMVSKWDPTKYRDTYHEDLLKLIEKKIKSGQTKVVEPAGKPTEVKRPGQVIDIMHLLQRSVEQAKNKNGPQRGRKAG
jgi:DNA end-binding protein Ku